MLAVQTIFQDDWQGVTSEDQESPCTSVEDAVKAIKALNGRNRTCVELICGENRSLTIGGGSEDRYVSYVTVGDQMRSLVDRSRPRGEVVIVAGGQQGVYQAEQCLDLDTVLMAAEHYVKEGTMEPSLTWTTDS